MNGKTNDEAMAEKHLGRCNNGRVQRSSFGSWSGWRAFNRDSSSTSGLQADWSDISIRDDMGCGEVPKNPPVSRHRIRYDRNNNETKRMKTIRTIIGTIGFIIAMLFAAKARSADATTTASFIAGEFKKGEVNIEAGYIARTEDLKTFEGSTYVGGNYLITQQAGIHAGLTGCDDLDEGHAIRTVEFGLIGRLPYKNVALEGGLGAEFALKPDEWAVYAELGPRVRFHDKVDVFVKVRGTRPIAGAEGESVGIICGLGLTF
jgi:hypothetical protein